MKVKQSNFEEIKMQITKKINESIRNKTLLQNIFYYFLMKTNFCSKSTVRTMRSDRAYYKIRKKYKKYLNKNDFEFEIYSKDDMNNVIWIFWYQGMDEAPELIKKCYQSIKNNLNDYKIIILDKNNYMNYVDIPAFIIKKFEKKIISITHFSDILRTAILVKYGGLWLDATVYCSGNKEIEMIEKRNFFVYRNAWWNSDTIDMESWLIYSKKNNVILKKTLELLYIYWKKNNYLYNYFLFHLFFKLSKEKYLDEWKDVPYCTQINNHLLAYDMEKREKFDKERINYIFKITDFHKLNYKNSLEESEIYKKIMNEYN